MLWFRSTVDFTCVTLYLAKKTIPRPSAVAAFHVGCGKGCLFIYCLSSALCPFVCLCVTVHDGVVTPLCRTVESSWEGGGGCRWLTTRLAGVSAVAWLSTVWYECTTKPRLQCCVSKYMYTHTVYIHTKNCAKPEIEQGRCGGSIFVLRLSTSH